MVDPLSIGLGVVNGLTSLSGLLGGNAARKRAQQAREAAIRDMALQLDNDYQDLVSNNRFNLLAATGQGGDAIRALGSNLGASMANAGVYNSSATAGALTQATDNQAARLTGLATENNFNEKSLLNQNRRYLSNLKLNTANDDLGAANQNLANSKQGLMSFLGSLTQYNLSKSGVTNQRNALPQSAGGIGNPSVLDPNSGLYNPFRQNPQQPRNSLLPKLQYY